MATTMLTSGSMTIGRTLSIGGSALVAIALLVVLISTATIVVIHATSIIVVVASLLLLLRGLRRSILLGASSTITHSIGIAIRVAAIHSKVATTTVAPLVEAPTSILLKILSLTVASRKFRLSTTTLFVVRAH